MGYHTGLVRAGDLFDTILAKITSVQPEASTAYWRSEASLASDSVYTSSGSTGSDRIVITLKEVNKGMNFAIGYAKDYTPGAINTPGTFISLQEQSVHYYSGIQNEDVLVAYHLSVTADRIIMHLQGDKLISAWQNPVVFLGMPLRYDMSDRTCVVKASSENAVGTANMCQILEDSVGVAHKPYMWKYVESTANPSWGGNFFLETLHFSLGAEGLRGEIDGLYGAHEGGLTDGDEIDINGKRYLVIIRRVVGVNNFPRSAMLMRMD